MRMIKLKDGFNAVELHKAGVKVIYNEFSAPVLIIDEVNNKLVYTKRDNDLIDYVIDLFSLYTFAETVITYQELHAFIESI